MKIEAVDLRRISIPMISPFRVSFGVEHQRDILLVRVVGAETEGWGECVAMSRPLYSAEYTDGAEDVMRRHLLPRLFEAGDVTADQVAEILRPLHGHPMAKAALEMAILDAELRAAGVSLADHLGAVRTEVDCGVSVGIHEDPAELVEVVDGYLAEGYRRIKLKIEPGHDVESVRAVRERFPAILLQVDANTAYTLGDAPELAKLDEFDLLLIEQPLAEDDV
jgi:O-succinylbenzoate synthase